MHFVVFTHAPTLTIKNKFSSYAPYVKEMDLWFSLADKVTIVCPTHAKKGLLAASFMKQDLSIVPIPALHFKSKSFLLSLIKLPVIFLSVFRQMKRADHIHLRCPGNVGLIACIVQIFFPKKNKSAKYAGNWDPSAKQPLSYNIQKWILKNPFLTKNMTVLVYGKWKNQTRNITSFFTASYRKNLKTTDRPLFIEPTQLLFVGTLAKGKSPLYTVQCLEHLLSKGIHAYLNIYGDGEERDKLVNYIKSNKLEDNVILHGNCTSEVIAKAYQSSHFIILPSQSEGWPKVLAEAMWWGCIPFATAVSCVPWMLDNGNRGQLLTMDINQDGHNLMQCIENQKHCLTMSIKAQQWSQQYTIDSFEEAIKDLLV